MSAADDRAKARKSWPIARRSQFDDAKVDLSSTTTVEERLAMMWPLALSAWSLTGKPLPDCLRSETPIRIVRRSLSGQQD